MAILIMVPLKMLKSRKDSFLLWRRRYKENLRMKKTLTKKNRYCTIPPSGLTSQRTREPHLPRRSYGLSRLFNDEFFNVTNQNKMESVQALYQISTP